VVDDTGERDALRGKVLHRVRDGGGHVYLDFFAHLGLRHLPQPPAHVAKLTLRFLRDAAVASNADDATAGDTEDQRQPGPGVDAPF